MRTDTFTTKLLDLLLAFLLGGGLAAQLAVGLPGGDTWSVSPAHALVGLNVLLWGLALLLAYRAPASSWLLGVLARVSQAFGQIGPFRSGPAWTLAWAVFFLFCGGLMLAIGAGWL